MSSFFLLKIFIDNYLFYIHVNKSLFENRLKSHQNHPYIIQENCKNKNFWRTFEKQKQMLLKFKYLLWLIGFCNSM